MYAIQAQVEHTTNDGWTGSHQVPTFYLDEKVQGILDEAGAIKVAEAILWAACGNMPMSGRAKYRTHITAVKV